ncbi:MAG: YbaK/EbsC family protein [Candidatus Omnitrophica bacterium]|nr:YbaK/EbsC family protein [Candidatus Omnitrophota bacterium]
MIPPRLKKFLQDQQTAYKVIPQSQIPDMPQEKAKVVMVKAAGKDVMVVLPSTAVLDPFKLGILLDIESIRLDSDEEVYKLFPDCEPDALPALGLPYDIPCFIDETLLDGEEVFFPGGNHEDAICINSDEYWRVAQGEVGDFRQRGISKHSTFENNI